MSASKQASRTSKAPETGVPVSAVQLSSINCHEYSVRFLRDFDQETTVGLDTTVNTGTAFRLSDDGKRIDIRATAIAISTLSGFPGSTTQDPFLEVRVAFDLRYVVVDESFTATPDLVVKFANAVGLFNAWPFLREAMHSACQKVGMMQVVLPLFPNPVQA